MIQNFLNGRRCSFCGKTEKQHKGKACLDLRSPGATRTVNKNFYTLYHEDWCDIQNGGLECNCDPKP